MINYIEVGRGIERDRFYRVALEGGCAVALWRLPHAEQAEGVMDLSGHAPRPIAFNAGDPGFVVSPFESKLEKVPFIAADFWLRGDACFSAERVASNGRSAHADKKNRGADVLQTLRTKVGARNGMNGLMSWYAGEDVSSKRTVSTSQEAFCGWVEQALKWIRRNELRKVVLSRILEVGLPKAFHPVDLFEKLCSAYPSAFVSLVAIPGLGTWIGATPELLLSLRNNELTTVALAGTRPVNPKNRQWPKQWSKKEIVEQAIVSDFIRECFAAQKLDFHEGKTQSVRIGDLLHLKTKFSLKNVSRMTRPQLENFLYGLHPTPAVCGVPQRDALAFIKERETHERALYAGYLGPVEVGGETNLFVNLRCLQMRQSSALLYAGCGITIDSIPRQEWLETDLKLNALLKLLPAYYERSESARSTESKILCHD